MKAKFATKKTNEYYIGTKEIAEVLGCGPSTAILRARELNNELQKKGYCVVAGKVPRTYFFERYGLGRDEEAKAKSGAAR